MDVVRRADLEPDGTHPCLVYGYGSYEYAIEPSFSASRLSLLDRGCRVGARPSARRRRARQALVSRRQAAEQAQHVHRHDRLRVARRRDRLGGARIVSAIRGRSAGGLLVGACVTMRPDLFAAALAEVPFVDVVNTMNDETLPLTVTEWEEWGDPREEPWASYMASYSPYDNIAADRVPGDVRHRRPQRPAGELPRAGEMGGEVARRRAPTTR